MSHQEVKVKRQQLAACITCHLCKELLTDATTITECLHSFCRECIYNELADGVSKCCPVCNIDLGCSPLEKLRADHNIQNLRDNLFQSKEIKKKSPEVVEPVALPAKVKEISLSSLVIYTPRVSGITRKRSKSTARKASRGPNLTIEKSVQKDDEEDQLRNSSLPDTLNKYGQNSAGKGEGSNALEGNGDPWKPLNCLVEAANRSNSLEFGGQGSAAETEPMYHHDKGAAGNKIKEKRRFKSKVQDEKYARDNAPLDSERPKRNRKPRAKKAHNTGDNGVPPQVILASRPKLDPKDIPVWFSLVAHEEPEANGPPLPQISANYIRVKDGSKPVSSIQKYLKAKLGLTTEDEVEIKCMGQTVIPSLTLSTLVELWIETTSRERVAARVGSSAKEFVMILGYARRPLSVS